MPRIKLRVKEVAEAQGINMTLLSHKSYVALNTIRAIYRNPYRTVNTDTLQRLADALGVSVFDLMEEVPDDDRNTPKIPLL
jgi:DNA-binding Xre family transcriptional regulator